MRWLREAVPTKNEPRTDIYYCIVGTMTKLRSWPDADKFCRKHKLQVTPTDFDFCGKNDPKQDSESIHFAPLDWIAFVPLTIQSRGAIIKL